MTHQSGVVNVTSLSSSVSNFKDKSYYVAFKNDHLLEEAYQQEEIV